MFYRELVVYNILQFILMAHAHLMEEQTHLSHPPASQAFNCASFVSLMKVHPSQTFNCASYVSLMKVHPS